METDPNRRPKYRKASGDGHRITGYSERKQCLILVGERTKNLRSESLRIALWDNAIYPPSIRIKYPAEDI